jgi:hypothetical protein
MVALVAVQTTRALAASPPGLTIAAAAPVTKNVYAVKFLCGELFQAAGTALEGPVKPGNYQTAINVHNPNNTPVPFRKKAVLLFPQLQNPTGEQFEVPQPPGEFFPAQLRPDWGMEIDCRDIRQKLLDLPPDSHFIKGWVVIEVEDGTLLDIAAAYTGHGFKTGLDGSVEPEGFSLQILPVSPTRVRK